MIGLPMLSGFVGEFLILSSTFAGVSRGWAIAAALGVILGAAYMLWLVQRLFYGPESDLATSKPIRPISASANWPCLRRSSSSCWSWASRRISGSTRSRPASIRLDIQRT